jgi:transposase
MPPSEQPSYAELAARNVELAARVSELLAVVAEQGALIETLRTEVAAVRRQAGRDSSNSSQPPSQDGPAAQAKARAARQAARRARPARPQGGQKGHHGASLAWAARPDETRVVEPGACGRCGADLAGAAGRVGCAVQVLDIPPAALTVTEYQMMSRTCRCGRVTTAPAPAGVTGGPVCYGPNVTAAAALLASTDVIGVERAADLMGALLKAPVSTGFVSRCLVRLDAALIIAGFEDALKDALRTADVLGTDETPAPLTTAARAEDCGNPHVYTVRTMHAYTGGGPDLIWYGAAGDRTKASITGFGILDGYRGVLVRDDYGGYLSYDARLAGVQQCLAHLYRYLDDTYAIDPQSQVWTRQAGDALRAAAAAVRDARDARQADLDPALLDKLRHSYDQAVACGISVNLSRPWHKGNHPGLILARRLKRKAAQVWLFATRFDVPATNNGSENAVRGYKLAAKISGCWRTLSTLQRHCRIRSYLTTARSHGHYPLAAIRDALAGNTWMPPRPA